MGSLPRRLLYIFHRHQRKASNAFSVIIYAPQTRAASDYPMQAPRGFAIDQAGISSHAAEAAVDFTHQYSVQAKFQVP